MGEQGCQGAGSSGRKGCIQVTVLVLLLGIHVALSVCLEVLGLTYQPLFQTGQQRVLCSAIQDTGGMYSPHPRLELPRTKEQARGQNRDLEEDAVKCRLQAS